MRPLELAAGGVVLTGRAALFDKDGTLLDLQAPWSAWGAALVSELEARCPQVGEAALAAAIGLDGGRVVPDSVLAGGSVQMLAETATEHLAACGIRHAEEQVAAAIAGADERVDPDALVRPLPGAGEVVRACHEVTGAVGVVTADDTERARAHLERLGLTDAVDVVVGADQVEASKPDPAGLLRACELLGVAPDQALYLGDSVHDAHAAARGGLAGCVLVRPNLPEGLPMRAIHAPSWDEVAVTPNPPHAADRRATS